MSNQPEIKIVLFNSQKDADASINRKGGGGPQRVPSEGSIQVRFLTEQDGWAAFTEIYDPTARTYRPMLVGETLPDDVRPTSRYLAPVLLRESSGDRVVPLKMARMLAQSVVRRGEKYGTITDRDMILSSYGKGLETRYEVDTEPPSKCNLAAYELPDLVVVLEEQAGIIRDDAEPTDNDDLIDSETAPVKSPPVDDDLDTDDDDEIIIDDDDDLPETTDDDDLTLEEVKAMSVAELKTLANELDVPVKAGIKKSELAQQVWDAL